jgi:excisionase family DNA binding protein
MATTTTEVPRLMKAEDVSKALRDVPVSTIHSWARSGYLPSMKLGKHRRFKPEEVADFIARHDAH